MCITRMCVCGYLVSRRFFALFITSSAVPRLATRRGKGTVSPTGEPYVSIIANNHLIRQIVSDIRVRYSNIVCVCYDGYQLLIPDTDLLKGIP